MRLVKYNAMGAEEDDELMQTLKELVEQLPPELQQEAKDFMEFLLEKRRRKVSGRPRFDWAGALKNLRGQYTSLELQHKISDWRTGQG